MFNVNSIQLWRAKVVNGMGNEDGDLFGPVLWEEGKRDDIIHENLTSQVRVLTSSGFQVVITN